MRRPPECKKVFEKCDADGKRGPSEIYARSAASNHPVHSAQSDLRATLSAIPIDLSEDSVALEVDCVDVQSDLQLY